MTITMPRFNVPTLNIKKIAIAWEAFMLLLAVATTLPAQSPVALQAVDFAVALLVLL